MTAAGPFGRALCAMITPFTPAGALDLDGAQSLADRLVSGGGCEGLVLNGTTGESPTTTDAEKSALVRAVSEAVGDRASVLAGVGSADTRHTVELARAAERAGADGLLVVTPYYSRPPQDAVEAHFRRVADAVGVPLMLYDIPGRTGTRIEVETMLRLAGHPRIRAVKDCAYDLLAAATVLARTDLAYYSGSEELNLPLYAVGGAGYVSTVANCAPRAMRAVLDAYDAGDTAGAALAHRRTVPLITLAMASGLPGTVTAKGLLGALGLPAGPVREPLRPAGRETVDGLLKAYEELTGLRQPAM
ncbi:4-hydroxy-tetrahydrodipicolinate synthase [Streptomyces agglomeratus]|uniref:4-hydroxy-tetrahydrodipicolinate synthase n=1 Tax=Streptomyces agglomeratus TaxID=285458 RepID=A0A1E5PDA1_9ACTN|nr:4-hydroxy-tetrahydrodipicolinate synthase [Streptomyces agglomeratus]OEJ27465.1 4-hydroxy-tetrahydrodipicolinate synthase [Streptomyces agglomeratus]OEJ38478.1 4-hydroxy-tetrahydrodipicolinate synthase [Streptomyces agglomeratus]OEJ47137.1 4-hydroxy-tetrahydrodipicolinate synthase [Streptomyces agglomeratus]OEJ51006.1 4-hydroxy-tetrahydrodipicolinate synthase [Streptomyces agglomeratus]OEJ58376.1 4-hydroxy-tetrahydrodipicolinate synthase [Streptomyces agglomeratus]